MSVDINTGGTNTNIPEELGKFKVNILQNGVNVAENVRQLWAKTSEGATSPQLVWEIRDTPIPTDIPTEIPPDPTCGVCLNESVFYPFAPALGRRWACTDWKATAKYDNINPTPVEIVDSAFGLPGYEVYVRNTGSPDFSPPPFGYILAEYVTYTIKDRMAMFLRKPLELYNGVHYANSTPDPTKNPFDPSVLCMAACDGGNACFISGYQPYSMGGSPPTCATLENIANGSVPGIIPQNILFDSTCTATSSGCLTSCYGRPSTTPISSPYVCRSVQSFLPPIKTKMVQEFINGDFISIPSFARYGFDPNNSDYKRDVITFPDLSFMLEHGCETGENSAWAVRIFLPIYVSLPANRRGKYIKILWQNTQYSQSDPVLNSAYDVMVGNIPAASLLLAIDDQTSQNHWGLVGCPVEGVHTHVVVLELESPVDNCNACINSGSVDPDKVRPNILRFYPITDALGTFLPNFRQYTLSNVQLPSNTTLYGLNTINQVTVQNPNLENYGYYYTGTDTKSNVPANTALTFNKYLNSYYQPQINSGSTAYDCNCNPI